MRQGNEPKTGLSTKATRWSFDWGTSILRIPHGKGAIHIWGVVAVSGEEEITQVLNAESAHGSESRMR